MILQLLLVFSMANACPKETKPKMFVLTPCSQCRKTHRDCLESAAPTQFGGQESEEQLTCDEVYVSCFRENKCQSEGNR